MTPLGRLAQSGRAWGKRINLGTKLGLCPAFPLSQRCYWNIKIPKVAGSNPASSINKVRRIKHGV